MEDTGKRPFSIEAQKTDGDQNGRRNIQIYY